MVGGFPTHEAGNAPGTDKLVVAWIGPVVVADAAVDAGEAAVVDTDAWDVQLHRQSTRTAPMPSRVRRCTPVLPPVDCHQQTKPCASARQRGLCCCGGSGTGDRISPIFRMLRSPYSCGMGPLRYSINVTLDGCCDHRAIPPDEELHRHAIDNLERADALLFGRVTYEMMESAWRPSTPTGARPDWTEHFAHTIDAARKYVVSSTLERVDWNAELVDGDLGNAVRQLKRESGNGLLVGGVTLPLALAELGLIDEYEFVVHPRLAGHGPWLFEGLSTHVDLSLVDRLEFGSGAVAMRYEPRG
jgi:dihydrofolate reductase